MMDDKITKITGEIPDYKVEGELCYKKGYYWVSPHNYELVDTSNDPEFVGIHDVTLRDGEQLPGVTFLEDERVAIAEALDEMNVTRIEAGMPAVSDIANNALKRIARNCHHSKIYGFARAMEKDVQLVLDSGSEGIIIEHVVSPYKLKYGYELTPEKLVDRLVRSLRMAKKNGLRTVFMGWDWFRAPIEFTHWLIEEVLNGTEFDGLTIVDTVGSTLPDAVEVMFRKFHTWYPQLELEFHGHNDFNIGNACALAAIKGGARVVHTSMNGLGERSGNIATEEVVLNLEVLKHIKTGVNLNKIDRTSRLISEISKVPIHNQKPILGIRNYTIESGIATDLTRKLGDKELRPSNGTIMPALIGREGGELFVFGKNSGISSIILVLEKYGMEATKEQLVEILDLVKKEALVTKALVPEATVMYFINQVLGK